LKADFSFLLPLGRQLGREALSSRSLVQMKMWWSNFGKNRVPFQSRWWLYYAQGFLRQ
jgi:hypothetical protein